MKTHRIIYIAIFLFLSSHVASAQTSTLDVESSGRPDKKKISIRHKLFPPRGAKLQQISHSVLTSSKNKIQARREKLLLTVSREPVFFLGDATGIALKINF